MRRKIWTTLIKSSRGRRSSLKDLNTRSHSSRNGYEDINQPSDRWEWQLIINTQQGRYKAKLKPPSRLHQRLEGMICKHTHIKD